MHEPEDLEIRLRSELSQVVAQGPDPVNRHAAIDSLLADRRGHLTTRRRILVGAAATTVIGGGLWAVVANTSDDRSRPVAAGPSGPSGPGRQSQWERIDAAPLSPRTGPAVVWAGDRLIVWGGALPGPPSYLLPPDGAAWSPSTNQWTAISPSPAGRVSGGFAVWDGTEMFVGALEGDSTAPWNDDVSSADAQYGLAAYAPASDSWRYLAPIAPNDDPGRQAIVVSDGLLVAPRSVSPATPADITLYDRDTGEQRAVDPGPFAGSPYRDRSGTVALTAVDDLVVATPNWDPRPWVLDSLASSWARSRPPAVSTLHLLPATAAGTVAIFFASDDDDQQPLVFDPRPGDGGTFWSGAPNPFPRPAWGHDPVWSGTELHVPGAAYDPVTDTWRAVPPPPRGEDRQRKLEAAWTDDALLLFGGEEYTCPDDTSCDRAPGPDTLDGWILTVP